MLTEDAAHAYLYLSQCAHDHGFISLDEMKTRMRVLKSLIDPDLHAILGMYEHLEQDFWEEEKERPAPEESAFHSDITADASSDSTLSPLFISKALGMKDWVFHPYDEDYFPSIPHGHYLAQPRPKLDPYTSLIWNEGRQTGHMKSQQIIDLWNDKAFREFAAVAVEFYIAKFPGFVWRVENPRRLPRKRRN